MAQRRTRKQKEKARHQFTISWKPEPKKVPPELAVKGQFKKSSKTPKKSKKSNKKRPKIRSNLEI